MNMISVYQSILSKTLFNDTEAESHVILPLDLYNTLHASPRAADEESIIKQLFPNNCIIHTIEGIESFPHELESLLQRITPSRLFMIPPWIGPRQLPSDLKSHYPKLGLPEIAISIAIDNLPHDALFGVVVPSAISLIQQTEDFRISLLEKSAIHYLIEHSAGSIGFYDVHHAFISLSLFLQITQVNDLQELPLFTSSDDQSEKIKSKPPVKFFRFPDHQSAAEPTNVTADFQRLTRMEGGETDYGYVYRSNLPADKPWQFELLHPERKRELEDIKQLGGIVHLKDLVEIRQGPRLLSQENPNITEDDDENDNDNDNRIPVITGREIQPNNILNYESCRYRWTGEAEQNILLQVGDILLRRIQGVNARHQSLFVAVVTPDMPRLIASDGVLILRPKFDASVEDLELLLAYLRSSYFMKIFGGQFSTLKAGSSVTLRITRSSLAELPVPIADSTIRTAFQNLREASMQYEKWQQECNDSINALFNTMDIKESRMDLLSAGRLTRQRHMAAKKVDDFFHRVRTQYPHPIAYRWRIVETQNPDLEGYNEVLDCAEVLICYLACMALLMSRATGTEIGYLKDMLSKLSKGNHGTSMGEWFAILKETKESKAMRKLPDSTPFVELTQFLQSEIEEASRALMAMRNENAHRKGPKGKTPIFDHFEKAKALLTTVIKASEFIAEYRLIYIEDTQRDSLSGVTKYQYRLMMGDHPLVPIESADSEIVELEKGSLYLVDRTGELHLMRPFLVRQECETCGNWSTFYLDKYLRDEGACQLLSMEHNHTMKNSDIVPAFHSIGMLLPDSE